MAPKSLRRSLYGRPIEEVDPFVFDDTFCVISKKYGHHYVFRMTAGKSLCLFGPLNPIRIACVRILSSQWFDMFIVLIILCNCVILSLQTNYEDGYTEKMKKNAQVMDVVEDLELVFLGVYSVEFLVKVIAKGLVWDKFSYLRNPWNVLDFVIVLAAWVSTIIAYFVVGNKKDEDSDLGEILEFFKPLRVFRVAKTINIIPGLRTMLNALLGSAIQLLEVMALTVFCLAIFALLALQLFMGRLRHRCVIRPPTNLSDAEWQEWVTNDSHWRRREYEYPHDEHMPCGNDSMARHCPKEFVCIPNVGVDNYDLGWINFDNFGGALLLTFQLFTLDFWERVYDLVLSTTSGWSLIFFLLVIFLGSFYLINLMLAVVAMRYEQEARKGTEEPLAKHQKLSLHRTSSSFSFDQPRQLNATLLTKFTKRSPEERERLAKNLRESMAVRSADTENTGDGERPDLHNTIMMLLGRRLTKETGRKSISTADVNAKKSDTVKSRTTAGLQIPDRRPQPKPDQPAETTIEVEKQEAKEKAENLVKPPPKGFFGKLRQILRPYVQSEMFEAIITTVIVVNTILLASEHHNQPSWLDTLSYYGSFFFLTIFTLEVIVKLFVMRREFFGGFWNVFDLFVVVISVADQASQTSIIVIRGMRILRVFKLAHSWITMKVLLNIIASTIGALGNLVLILAIVIYIFAVLGLQTLGKHFVHKAFDAVEDEEKFPRWNFQSFWYSFMMVFRIVCGEWIEPLIECFQATSYKNKHDEPVCFLIYLPTFVIGNVIILNLFLALLLNSFDTEELQRLKQLEGAKKTDNLKKVVGMILGKDPNMQRRKSDSDSEEDDKKATGKKISGTRIGISRGKQRFRAAVKKVIMMNRKALAIRMIEKADLKNRQMVASRRKNMENATALVMPQRGTVFDLGTKENQFPDPCFPRKCLALNCAKINCRKIKFRQWTRFRYMVLLVVNHPLFEYVVLALILASSIMLCFEDIYLPGKPDLQLVLTGLNIGFTTVFLLEMLLKMIAFGLWNYFTSAWTIFDFFIIIVSVVSVGTNLLIESNKRDVPSQNLEALKVLRVLRALRPLRAISRWQGMKIVVNALMVAIPSIFNVLLVCLLFWLIFSIMGVQFFRGKFYKCVDNVSGEKVSNKIIATKEECCQNTDKYSWINQEPNFDNVLQGYLTLLQVATFEGWMEAMEASVDSTEIDQQPSRDNALYYYFFYVVFILFGSFFTLNLFIGVIIDNFNRLKKQYEGNLLEALLTPSQRNYYLAMKKLGRKKPRKVIKRPTHPFLALFYDMSMSRRFEVGIFAMIFLNMVILGLETVNQRELLNNVLSAFNAFFTTVYAIEAVVKIIGLRQFYFRQGWNVFDFVLVVLSCVDLGTGGFGDSNKGLPIPPTMLRVIRVFRIGRILRLIKAAKGIRKLLFALVVSLPALFNIGALLALLTFIYAILGMSLFAEIELHETLDDMFNFQTFYRSCLILLRVMTAAGWNDVLLAMTPITPVCGNYRNIHCGRDGERECANVGLAIAYLVTFLIISYLIIINMYIAVILENFYEANREEEIGIVEDDLEMFYVHWSRYDPQATQFISFDHLSEFLSSLDPPLRIKKPNVLAIVAFNLPIARGNKIHCLDILHALVKHLLGHIEDSEEMRKLQEQMEHEFRKQFPSRKLLDIISSTRIWKIQHNAAVVIQRAWREYYARKHPMVIDSHAPGPGVGVRGSVISHRKSHHAMLNMMNNLFGQGHKRESIFASVLGSKSGKHPKANPHSSDNKKP